MPSWTSISSFAIVVALVTVTPGLDTALVLRATLRGGRRQGAAAAGVSLGVLAWAAAAATGVSALLAASQLASTVLRLVGAAYMVVLGVRHLRTARRETEDDLVATPDVAGGTGTGAAFRSGLLTNLLNPKVGAFYVALLPPFLGPGSPLVGGMVLGLVHVAEGIVWFALLVGAATAARRRFARPGFRRWVDGVTGAVLVAFGLVLGRSAVTAR